MLDVVDRCGTENHLSSIVNSFDHCQLPWRLLNHHLLLDVFVAEVKFVRVIVLKNELSPEELGSIRIFHRQLGLLS